jgi:hypothetical protein
MLHRLCEPPSIPLSFSLATILPRRGTYHFGCGREPQRPPTQCPSFRARTTGVSNPVRSPGFRASASEEVQRGAFAAGVPSDLNAFHRSTGSSPRPYLAPARQYLGHFPGWAGGFHPRLGGPPTRPLSPVNPNNVRTVRLTAAAGTNLARASFGGRSGLAALLPPDSALQPEGLRRARGVARSGLRPLPKILDCSLP